ncbi:Peptide chain release factor 1 (eRF1) [Desulfarculus baarsii DSM 2075]|uniref:Peptide chain release factor 1 (ERF1) n=2 Tax=Desulfarculus baarsii TaxID=453230 RepID=E1QFD9_DESB2|nr:Peptide chain release factor 1 (eRF1) [Desulfarculus baarsii DSM 2075]
MIRPAPGGASIWPGQAPTASGPAPRPSPHHAAGDRFLPTGSRPASRVVPILFKEEHQMLDATTLRHLAQLDAHPHGIVSLYLSLDGLRDARGLAMGEMIKRAEKQLQGNGAAGQWDDLAADRQAIMRHVEELPADHGRGLAVFSSSKSGMFQAYALAAPVPNMLEVGPAPYIRPLAALASDHRRSLTVLIDRKAARLFFGYLGEVRELELTQLSAEEGVFERDGGQGRAGDNQVGRWEDQAAARFHKAVTAIVKNLCHELDCQQLIVGGARQAADEFAAQLPPELAKLLAGSFVADCGAPAGQVAQHIAEVQEKARRVRQHDLLRTMSENLGPGGKVATGLNQVLASVYEGQVRTLVVKRGYRAAGGVCPACGRLRHVAEPCPICGQKMTAVADVVNLAVARALASGARLEQVAEDSILDDMGGVAAMLRYS